MSRTVSPERRFLQELVQEHIICRAHIMVHGRATSLHAAVPLRSKLASASHCQACHRSIASVPLSTARSAEAGSDVLWERCVVCGCEEGRAGAEAKILRVSGMLDSWFGHAAHASAWFGIVFGSGHAQIRTVPWHA